MDSYVAKMLYQYGALNGQFAICAAIRNTAAQYKGQVVDGEQLLLGLVNGIESNFRTQWKPTPYGRGNV